MVYIYRALITIDIIFTSVLRSQPSLSNIYPVIFGERFNSLAEVGFEHIDYNNWKGLVAVGGAIKGVSMFAANTQLSTSLPNSVPLMCLYDETNDMTLLWSKTFSLSNSAIKQIAFSPNGEKIAVHIGSLPPVLGVFNFYGS